MALSHLKFMPAIARLRKTRLYGRLRQYLPMTGECFFDDREEIEGAEIVTIDWPQGLSMPKVGLVRDFGPYPRWTKIRRFLENNGFEWTIYELHAHDWIDMAGELDLVVGFVSSEWWHLQEMREKYRFLETYLQKATYPSPRHADLYEAKRLEAYICRVKGVPFARTHISYDRSDALQLVEKLNYPVVSKIVPASGSAGVELVENSQQARRVVEQSFSPTGRKTYTPVFRQKNYVYFQDFVPNDGYDTRCIVVGNWVWGYYRKVPNGDFRASGMSDIVEKRALPEKAMRTALALNQIICSPMLVVDMVLRQDGNFIIIEYSPICRMDTPEQAHLNERPGAYVFAPDGSFRFQEGRYWVQELAMREFLLQDYLPQRLRSA